MKDERRETNTNNSQLITNSALQYLYHALALHRCPCKNACNHSDNSRNPDRQEQQAKDCNNCKAHKANVKNRVACKDKFPVKRGKYLLCARLAHSRGNTLGKIKKRNHVKKYHP